MNSSEQDKVLDLDSAFPVCKTINYSITVATSDVTVPAVDRVISPVLKEPKLTTVRYKPYTLEWTTDRVRLDRVEVARAIFSL